MDVIQWIQETLKPMPCTSVEFIYNDMDSQSGQSLPLVYQPFDPGKEQHWKDRGHILDYLLSTQGEDRRLLDFGPGDGWPSLIVAAFAKEIVGVDASSRRVQVCTENAKRLGIFNARFVCTTPGSPLPFESETFDGVMAASSIEQTPDPKFILQEFFRVLRPDGRLRINYEALGAYRNGKEREMWVARINSRTCRLVLYDRHIDEELSEQYGVTFDMSRQELADFFRHEGRPLTYDELTVELLERLRPHVLDARTCTLFHPSGRTIVSWLSKIGFREIIPSHSGGYFAGQLFRYLPEKRRPDSLAAIDELLKPLVSIVVQMHAPLETDPMITAVK